MVFLEDRSGILRWKIFGGISVRPLGAKTGTGREAAGDSVTFFCPFWVKHKKGQEEKVFLVPFLYMRPRSSHTWALLCTQDELGQLHKVGGVPLSEIGGVVPGTREVSGADKSAALTARVGAAVGERVAEGEGGAAGGPGDGARRTAGCCASREAAGP